ncbi:hypothetical protein EVG20_g11597, partial [Dentipellis fragilis]
MQCPLVKRWPSPQLFAPCPSPARIEPLRQVSSSILQMNQPPLINISLVLWTPITISGSWTLGPAVQATPTPTAPAQAAPAQAAPAQAAPAQAASAQASAIQTGSEPTAHTEAAVHVPGTPLMLPMLPAPPSTPATLLGTAAVSPALPVNPLPPVQHIFINHGEPGPIQAWHP